MGSFFISNEAADEWSLTRAFNNFKDIDNDRQIGDRRGMNSQEGKVLGPSRNLPAGSDLVDLALHPRTECLKIYATDRRDFYHQFWVTPEKARCNAVGPKVPLSSLHGLHAVDCFISQNKERPRASREDGGDGLLDGGSDAFFTRPSLLLDNVHVCFKSLFQGDHVGVEVATAAHENLLKTRGLLADSDRIIANVPFHGGPVCQGLVIDDFSACHVRREGRPPKIAELSDISPLARRSMRSTRSLDPPTKMSLERKEPRSLELRSTHPTEQHARVSPLLELQYANGWL